MISASNDDAYLGIKWPGGYDKLKLSVTSGARTMSLNLEKPNYYLKDLVVYDTQSPSRKAKEGETLYLVKAPLKDEKATVSWSSNIDPLVLKDHYTVDGNNPTSNLTSNKISYSFSESPSKSTYHLDALGYDKRVKVEDYYRYGYKALPGNLDEKLASLNDKILKPFDDFAGKINEWMNSNKLKAEAKPIKIIGEKYNEEVKSSRHYNEIIKQGISGGASVKASTPTLYPPILAPFNIKGVSEMGAFLAGSVELDIVGNRYEATNGETMQIDMSNSKFTIEGKVSGCVEAGLHAKLLVAEDQLEFSASGSGKGCVSGKIEYNFAKSDWAGVAQIEPLLWLAKIKAKSKGELTLTHTSRIWTKK